MKGNCSVCAKRARCNELNVLAVVVVVVTTTIRWWTFGRDGETTTADATTSSEQAGPSPSRRQAGPDAVPGAEWQCEREHRRRRERRERAARPGAKSKAGGWPGWRRSAAGREGLACSTPRSTLRHSRPISLYHGGRYQRRYDFLTGLIGKKPKYKHHATTRTW